MAQTGLEEQLRAAERAVWDALLTGDAAADSELLDDAFLGVYPDGYADKSAHVGQLATGPSLDRYRLSEDRVIPCGTGYALYAYRADYVRAGKQAEETMYVSSLWRWDGTQWRNLFSQDTPAEEKPLP